MGKGNDPSIFGRFIPIPTLVSNMMKAENFTCTICNAQLSTNFMGKAESRNWDLDTLTCTEHFTDVEGAILVGKER